MLWLLFFCYNIAVFCCGPNPALNPIHNMIPNNKTLYFRYDEDLGGSCSMDEVVALMYSRYDREEAEEHVKEMREADDGDGELSFAEYLSCVEKRPPLSWLRRRGSGIAASKSIYIDWLAIMEAKKDAQKQKHG